MDREKVMVLGIDPGSQHVGFSIGQGWAPPLGHGIEEPSHFLEKLKTTPATRIVIERFDIRQLTLDSVATIKLIGVIEWIAGNRSIDVGWVNASEKVKFIREVNQDLHITSHAGDAEAIRRYDLAYGKW